MLHQILQRARLHGDTQRHAGNTPYRLLDAFRGIASLWVVMLHARLDTTPTFFYWLSAGGHLGVPMFFVISGYCIAHASVRSLNAPRPVLKFLTARVRRIYPPYALASLAAASVSVLLTILIQRHIVQYSALGALNLFHQGWRFYLAALTITQVPLDTQMLIPPFWSLSYEVAFYGIVAVTLLVMIRAKQTMRLLDVLNVLTVGSLLWLDLAEGSALFPFNLWPQFGMGVLVYQILAQPQRSAPRGVFLLCSALIVIFAWRHGDVGTVDGVSGTFQTLFYLGFSVLLLVLFRWDGYLAGRWPVKIFAAVGMFSYSLYLIHILALSFLSQISHHLHGLEARPLLLYLVKLGLSVALGRVFFHFCERPFLDTRQRQVRLAAAQQPTESVQPVRDAVEPVSLSS